jgi:hypothetical protein
LKHLMWVSAQEDVSEDLVNLLIWCREYI